MISTRIRWTSVCTQVRLCDCPAGLPFQMNLVNFSPKNQSQNITETHKSSQRINATMMKINGQIDDHKPWLLWKWKQQAALVLQQSIIEFSPRTALIDVKLASTPSALGPLSDHCFAKKFNKREKKRKERDWFKWFHSPKMARKDLKEEVMRSAAE